MKLIVCLPGNNFSGQFLDHFIAFYNWCIRNNIHIMVCRRESCNIYYVYATVENWDENHFLKYGSFEFLTTELINGRKNPFTVDYTGFGFILVKKGVFESLKYPWFRPLWKQFGNVTEFTMEDVSFCHMVKDLGYKVWVHPQVVVNHEKKILL